MVSNFLYISINTLRPRQDDQRFPDIFKCTFLNENVWISIKISLKFLPKGSINQYPSNGSNNGLAPNSQQAIIWTNGNLDYSLIYASFGLNELNNGTNAFELKPAEQLHNKL